jgi:hypothetical protein
VKPVCRNCRKPIERKRHPGGKLEQLSRYRNRKYCSPRCHRIVRNEEASFPIKPWMRDYLQAFDRYLGSGSLADRLLMAGLLDGARAKEGTR